MGQVILEEPRRLERWDQRSDFDCGDADLNEWLRRFAWQNQRARNSVTYVACGGGRVLGYYALAAASVSKEVADEQFGRGRPQEIPCVLLARLAVDRRAQGNGLGAALVRDAITRAMSASSVVGAAALLIHCKDARAKAFYLAIGDFLTLPGHALTLLLPLPRSDKRH